MICQEQHLWPALPAPNPNLRIGVVLPVRNESADLERALSALAAQQGLSGEPFDPTQYEVILLANNCDDNSAALARAFAARHPSMLMHVVEVTLPPALANIGHVRRLLMDQACLRLSDTGHHGAWIASTDGDTVVAPDWLAHNERELAAGAHAVGGRIHIDPRCFVEPRTLRLQRLDAAFRLARSRLEDLLDPDPADPWPRHHQHFCGSLAITKAAYVQVGGLPEVTYLEDQALVDVLRRHDLSIRYSPQVKVRTSARQEGRAEVGLAWQLRQWTQDDRPALVVEVVNDWLERVQARRDLRLLWLTSTGKGASQRPALKGEWQCLASRLGVPLLWLMSRTASSTFFGALWAEVQARRDGNPSVAPVAVRDAIDQTRALVAAHLASRAVRPSASIRKVASR